MSILIIDDEEIILQTLSAIFKREGIEADVESNPVTALKRYEQNRYNVALVDILMPEMKGAEVIKAIKAINPLCNIIVMTAFSKMAYVVECIEAGAVDYLTKPFADISLLLNIIRSALERVDRWKMSFGLNIKKSA